jgi:hypothetical protein
MFSWLGSPGSVFFARPSRPAAMMAACQTTQHNNNKTRLLFSVSFVFA